MAPWRTGRSVVCWTMLAAATAVVVASVFEGATAGTSGGEGWAGVPVEVVFAGGPLVVLALCLRSQRRSVARGTAVAAALLAIAVAFVLVQQVLDPNEILRDRLVQGAALSVYLAAFVVEVPAFSARWPSERASGSAPLSVRGGKHA